MSLVHTKDNKATIAQIRGKYTKDELRAAVSYLGSLRRLEKAKDAIEKMPEGRRKKEKQAKLELQDFRLDNRLQTIAHSVRSRNEGQGAGSILEDAVKYYELTSPTPVIVTWIVGALTYIPSAAWFVIEKMNEAPIFSQISQKTGDLPSWGMIVGISAIIGATSAWARKVVNAERLADTLFGVDRLVTGRTKAGKEFGAEE